MNRRSMIIAAAATVLCTCRPLQSAKKGEHTERARNYKGPLVDPALIPFDFLWEQRVTAHRGESKGSFDAVVQKRGPELLVLGLTPMNTRAFSLTQRGTEYRYEQFVPFRVPFPPQSVLFDIHRAFFYELLEDFPKSGTRERSFADERIVDEFRAHTLVRRTFENVSGTNDKLVIEYSPTGYAGAAPPEIVPPDIVDIENFGFGYRLRVETQATRAL